MMECIFCKKLNPDDIIYQTKYWQVFLAWDQRYIGRCIIALKRHCEDLAELNEEEWNDFAELVKKFESALKKSFNDTMFNWTCLMNDAYKEKVPHPYVHWHVRPRYNHKVKLDNLVFQDSEFGSHYERKPKREVSEEVKKMIIEKIKNNFPI